VVKKALVGLEGVKGATVSFKGKRADVLYDPESVTVEDMINTISRVGFKAKVLEGTDGGS
jgi:copper chaperone CopZ